jgi:hypothetical protein
MPRDTKKLNDVDLLLEALNAYPTTEEKIRFLAERVGRQQIMITHLIAAVDRMRKMLVSIGSEISPDE